MSPPDGNHFRLRVGYAPNFAASRIRIPYDGLRAPEYSFHTVDAIVGWQYTSQYVDFNLAARLGINFYNPSDSAYAASPGFITYEPGLYASIHGRPAPWIGIGGGVFVGPQIWTGHADVGAATSYHFDPNVTAMIAPELTLVVYPAAGFSIEAGARLLVTPSGFNVPAPRAGDPEGRIEPSTVAAAGILRVGYSF